MFKFFKNLFKPRIIMKILIQNYVVSLEDGAVTITDNETEKEIIKLPKESIGEFKRAINYIEEEAKIQ